MQKLAIALVIGFALYGILNSNSDFRESNKHDTALGDETIESAFQNQQSNLQVGGSHWSDFKPLPPPQTMVHSSNGQTVESLPDDFYSTHYYTESLLEFLE